MKPPTFGLEFLVSFKSLTDTDQCVPCARLPAVCCWAQEGDGSSGKQFKGQLASLVRNVGKRPIWTMGQAWSRTCHFCPGGKFHKGGMGQNPEDVWVCPRQKTGIRPMEHGQRHL